MPDQTPEQLQSTHLFTVSYPRGTWPVYSCTRCCKRFTPTLEEMNSDIPPSFWRGECVAPDPLTDDDIQWLTGTGRFAQ